MNKPLNHPPIEKLFEILKSTFFNNVMYRTWIDVVLSLNSSANKTFKRLEKNQNKWEGPVFGHDLEWLIDFTTNTNFSENITLSSIYTIIYSKTDSLIARIFDIDFSLSKDEAVREFLHFLYYEKRDDELKKFRKKKFRFSETIFKYNYLLQTPECLYEYQPLKDRIDLSEIETEFKDSYQKEEYFDELLPLLWVDRELPNVAENICEIYTKTQNKHMGLKYKWGPFSLKEELEFFNGVGRKMRNNIVHYEMGKQSFVDLNNEDLQQLYLISEHIEFCIILNLMFNVFPDTIMLLDFDFKNDKGIFE